MTDKDQIKINPETLAHEHGEPVNDLEGVEQVVGLFDEQLSRAERIALGIESLVPTDEVIVTEVDEEP